MRYAVRPARKALFVVHELEFASATAEIRVSKLVLLEACVGTYK